MSDASSLSALVRELGERCTVDRLTKMTAALLDAHRSGRMGALRSLAGELGDWLSDRELEPSRLFSRLVLLFHPDRLRHLSGAVRDAAAREDTADLHRLLRLFHAFDSVFGGSQGAPGRPVYGGEASTGREEYGYDEADFDEVHSAREAWFGGDSSEDAGDEDSDAGEEDEVGERYEEPPGAVSRRSLFDAIYSREYGHVSTDFAPRHLETFEGEMDLSDYEITDLQGAEYLTGIQVLQLSENRIRSAWILGGLSTLEELYLAGNELEDVDGLERLGSLRILDIERNEVGDLTPLFDLPRLEYVNAIGNPVPIAHVERLRAKGVVVLAGGSWTGQLSGC